MALLSAAEAADVIAAPGTVLLDVRTGPEFAAARITGARQADWYRPDFTSLIAGMDRQAATVVYCRTGHRSADAARLMEALGFSEVHDLAGGIVAWYEAGLPIEQ
jgi:rhodanese-related sulfurtransferase